MNQLQNRHTFHYLDLPQLDKCFYELDVYTFMVEGELANKAARLAFKGTQGVAIGVQMVAYAVFSAFKILIKAATSLQSLCKRSVVLLIDNPSAAVKKRFFPSKTDLLEMRMEHLNRALKERRLSAETIACKGKEELSHDEKKELMNHWLSETLGQAQNTPVLQELCQLLNQLADRDVADDVLVEAKEKIDKLVEKNALVRRFPGLHSVAKAFIRAFEKEEEFEDGLHITTIERDFSLLLKHPNLLKREDVSNILGRVPANLKSKIIAKRNEVIQRALTQAHKEEQKFLSSLESLKPLSEEELKEEYLSASEKEYLVERRAFLSERLKRKSAEKSFEQRFFEFESYHLNIQEERQNLAELSMKNLSLDEANKEIEAYALKACKMLSKRVNKPLEELPKGGWEKQLQSLIALCKEVEQLEMKAVQEGVGGNSSLNLVNESLAEYESYHKKMEEAQKEVEPWKTLSTLLTVEERVEERKSNFAKDVICLSMEKKAECQLPLLLAKQDARTKTEQRTHSKAVSSPSSEAKEKLEQAAQEFVTSVQNKHVDRFKAKLLSFMEFGANLRGGEYLSNLDAFQSEKEEMEKKGPSFSRLALELELSEDLNNWHAQLQEIWAEHMPREQEEMILSLRNNAEMKKKMSEFFGIWLEKLTGMKVSTPLLFDRVSVQNRASAREEAIEKRLVQNPNFQGVHRFVQKVRDKITRQRAAIPASDVPAFNSSLIEQPLVATPLTIPSVTGRYQYLNNSSTDFEDLISTLEKLRRRTPNAEQSEVWIQALDRHPKLQNSAPVRFIILAECMKMARNEEEMSMEVQDIFLKHHKTGSTGEFDFETMTNHERTSFLIVLLHMLFQEEKDLVLTEKQRSHLIQLLFLSDIDGEKILEKVSVGQPNDDRVSKLLEEVGREMQASPVQLEGVEESTLQKSFQFSNLPENPMTRSLLDANRAVCNETLSLDLLEYVYAQYDLDHDQGREAIARALIHAYSHHPEEVVEHIDERIELHKNDSFDPKTLAVPLPVFYRDILRQLEETTELDFDFNNELIASKNANQMLLGYARKIAILGEKEEWTHEEFYELLKSKIAYQFIKLNYFDKKKEVAGFLKTETDRAEQAMMITAEAVQEHLEKPDALDEIKRHIETDRSQEFSSEQIKKEFSNSQGTKKFIASPVPGFIALGTRVKFDCVTGIIYSDGRQQVALSPHLQNHPAICSLGIQFLPYTFDPNENSFVYYTKEKDEMVPQITIKEVNHQPVIQKRLTTQFDSVEQEELQYVSKENVTLPIAVLHRLGIKSFWQNQSGTLFGYDKEGSLVAILSKGHPYTVKTKEGGSYSFVKQDNAPSPILSRLINSFNPNEILVSLDKTIYFVPAVGLKFTKEVNRLGETQWVTEKRGMGRKVLDLSVEDAPCLIFRNENNYLKGKQLKRQIKEQKYRLQLDQKEGLPHLSKHAIEARKEMIAKLETALKNLEDRIYLATLPDEAYNEELMQDIFDLIPIEWSAEFQLLGQYPYQGYHEVLEFLSGELQKATRELMEDDQNAAEEIQEKIHKLLKAYNTVQAQYESCCDKSLESVFFNEAGEECLETSDLTAALTLALKGAEKKGLSLSIVKELAKYSFEKPLTDSQVQLLQKTLKVCEESELTAYLQLMNYMHHLYQIQELAHTPLADKKEKVQMVNDAYLATKLECEASLKSLPKKVSRELAQLWRKSGLVLVHEALQEPVNLNDSLEKNVKPVVTGELQQIASKSLLERVGATKGVKAVHKNPAEELSKQQKDLIRSFQKHSHDQVTGFYLEEMGHFNLDGLYAEFKVDQNTEAALFGLKKKDVKAIFQFLQKEGHISAPTTSTNYYYLTSTDTATTDFPANAIRALLTDLPLTEEQITLATNRVQSFLFRAMQSGFKFSFKEGVEEEVELKLAQEKENHLQKALEAEAILKSELPKYDASYGDLKYALLSGDYTKFAKNGALDNREMVRLSNAMTRYLFHKSEVQHIENCLKAPAFGERNKIELLQTKRNYPVDLLFQEGLVGEKRKEQIMQRAFLAFEEDYGFRCNILQIKMFRSLILDTDHEEAVDASQARMGFGKTALLPLMAIVRVALERKTNEAEKHMVRYVVPRAVIEDNKSSFNQRVSSVLGGNVIKDREFTRFQIDSENPEQSFEFILLDLEARLKFYQETKKRGNVLIQWPEIRGSMESQELDFGEMLVKETLSPNVRELCLKAKRLLGEIRSIPTYTVFDELDDTQDIKSREVNFTRGDKKPIPHSTIRPLEKLLTYIEQNKNKDWKNLRERAADLVRDLCTDRQGGTIQYCEPQVINYLVNRSAPINDETKALLSEALVDDLTEKETPHTENDSMLFLIRSLLLDENILALTKSKQPNTHFGARFFERDGQRIYYQDPESESTLLIAVPYEGTNTPKGLSIFDNTEVAAITTMRYYRSHETLLSVRPHLDFLLKQIQRGALPKHLCEHYAEESLIDELERMAGMLDAEELRVAKEKFHRENMENPTDKFRKFFAMAVVTTQIRSDEACAKSDRYEKGSCQNIEKGCSGTVGGTSSYFAKQATDAAADGKLSIEIMGRANNAEIKWLKQPDPKKDYLEEIIETLLEKANENTRAIVDAAGMCKSRDGTPEAVVVEIWTQIKAHTKFGHIEGIVYYGRDNIKRLYRGPNLEAIPCTTAMELAATEGKRYFSFYGQKNTRGSDIKQANGAHSLVTLDENVSNSDAKQAVLRFRNLVNRDSEQTFSFGVMPSFEGILKETLKFDAIRAKEEAERELISERSKTSTNRDNQDAISALEQQVAKVQKRLGKIETLNASEIETKEIANYLRLQEKNKEEKGGLSIFRKEMKAHIKQTASHLEASVLAQLPEKLNDAEKGAYQTFLEEKSKIVSFVEYSINTLYLKYGTETEDTQRNLYIQRQVTLAKVKLDKLFDKAGQFASAVGKKVTLEKQFYVEHINRSKSFFEERFDEHTPVQTSHVNADGEAVAEALAQAEAEAEATSLAEKLAEGIIDVLDRFHTLHLNMATDPHLEVDFSYLDDQSQLVNVEDFAPMQNLIRPDLRDRFKVSPLLTGNQALASQFVLIGDSDIIFITQQEADAFAKIDNDSYSLFDARKVQPDDETLAQIPCAILGDNQTPKESIKETAQLRGTNLTNVTAGQLVPTLAIESAQELGDYFEQGAFGVGGNLDYAFEINPSSANVQIEVNAGSFSRVVNLPKDNAIVKEAIEEEFAKGGSQKTQAVYDRILEEYNKYLPLLQQLKREKAALDALDRQDRDAITRVSVFNLSWDMRNGMSSRDSNTQSYNYDNSLTRIGVDTINHIDKILRIQQELRTNPSSAKLQELGTAFERLVSQEIIEKAAQSDFDYRSEALFSREEWKDKKRNLSAVPYLEQNYGRIVHAVHGSSVSHARDCARLDCRNMFLQLIPALIDTIRSLKSTIEGIKQREPERQRIHAEIQRIEARSKPLRIALKIAKELLEGQKEIEGALAQSGVYFNEGEFFDQFILENYCGFSDEVKANFRATLPNYTTVIENQVAYQKALKALTEEESRELQKSQRFLRNVLNLARQVEDRSPEVSLV